MMQGQKNLQTVSQLIMSELTPLVGAHYGAFFIMDAEGNVPVLKLTSSYAYRERKHVSSRFRCGEGLVGQCALEKKPILLTQVPPDYIQIGSGLGEGTPLNIIVLPVLFEGAVKAIIELASFCQFSAIHQIFLDQLTESFGVVLNMISANMRTEELLLQSQGLTQELQSQSKELTGQQEELKRSNARLERQALELEDKARLLEEQNRNVEVKNREVEQARVSLEEKAAQLALISKYKSEFLANMSHELRTPLNSLLILAKLLADNKEQNLSDKQTEYAKTIHASGVDLLALINEILDLSRVEAGKMKVEPTPIPLPSIKEFVERSFRAVAEESALAFETVVSPSAPATIVTDARRLQQVLKNLLANAFKFTEKGNVALRIDLAPRQTRFQSGTLNQAVQVIAFSVTDTGVGVSPDKQQLIFEAFQQADGTTSRKYGGTGLGLSISREIAKLLGGEIHVKSSLGAGSTFTLYLPQDRAWESTEPEPEPLALPAAPAGSADATLAGLKVLVVDDDVRNVFALTSVLESHEAEVLFAFDGRAGIATLDATPDVDVVLLDVMMPEMDGYETLNVIRARPAWAHLPVIAVTAKALKGDCDKCLQAGATDYVAKPVDSDKLVDLLHRWVSAERARAAA
jgi:signal transduction histidine kinase/ActR/RegA family two-component response regulator